MAVPATPCSQLHAVNTPPRSPLRGFSVLLLAVSVPTARSVQLPRIALPLAGHGGVAAL